MSLLYQNSLPGERRLGLIFAEKFKTQTETEANGGVVGSGVSISNGVATFDNTGTAEISYNRVYTGRNLTYVFVFTPTAIDAGYVISQRSASILGANIYLDGSGNILFYDGGGVSKDTGFNYSAGERIHFALSVSGTTATPYKNGTAGTPVAITAYGDTSYLYLGDREGGATNYYGTLEDVKIFGKALAAGDIEQYYKGTMFHYDQYRILDLPMRTSDHDPTNTRTLDRSKNRYEVQFGDGSTSSTFPTKLTRTRGYDLDGINDYFSFPLDSLNLYNSGTLSILLKRGTSTTNTIYHRFNASVNGLQVFINVGVLSYYTNGIHATTFTLEQRLTAISIVLDGTTIKTYADGELVDTRTGVTLFDVPTANSHELGKYAASYSDAKIYSFYATSEKLTAIQVADLHQKMRGGLNVNN